MGQAELVVQYLDTDNQEALLVISDETMKKLLEKTNLEEIKAQIGTDWGDRKSVGNVYTVELTQMGKRSAVVQMHVAYENESVMYTISFNQEMEMTGLWLQQLRIWSYRLILMHLVIWRWQDVAVMLRSRDLYFCQ